MTTPAWYAEQYITRYGWHVVPIEPGRKFPKADDWGNNTLSTADAAASFYTNGHSDWNIGVALGPSRVCSFDIDCEESVNLILTEFGLPLDALDEFPTIRGKGRRVMFRVPDGVDLPYTKLNWPSKNDPSGDKHKAAMKMALAAKNEGDTKRELRIRNVARRWANYTVFELRAACDGKQRQDVAPPSIHPETGQPYKWEVQPPKSGQFPDPPAWLLAIWQHWDDFKPQFKDACPWIERPALVPPKSKPASTNTSGSDVIGAFCDAHDIEAMLDQYGYKRIGRRYLSPHSGTGLPGVVLFDDNRCWIHHASDPLCSEENNQPVNPFDMYCHYDHGGDVKKAVKTAAELLGMKPDPVRDNRPPPVTTPDEPRLPDRSHANIYEPLPFTDGKGDKPVSHIENLKEICRRLQVTLRYNVIKKEEEILIPGQSFTSDNEANAALAWLESECSLFKMPTQKLPGFITYISDQNQFNPVVNWVESKPWDGTPRLAHLYETVVAKGQEESESLMWLKETLIKRWMISAVAAAFSPDGISAHGVLVFQGDQYLGKTKWFKTLVPQKLDLLKDGMLLRTDDKDSIKQIVSYWLVELGELDATFRKSDIAALKAFITNDHDVLRRAYARRESHFARRTVFFGSVNQREFLHDQTGNRRYWTIECESLDHSHELDMQQVWAEVYALWKSGEGYYLLPDEMAALNEHNEGFMTIDPIEERIHHGLAWHEPESVWRWEQATQILIECGVDRPGRADATTAAVFIRKKNNGQSKRSNGKTLLFCPSPVNR